MTRAVKGAVIPFDEKVPERLDKVIDNNKVDTKTLKEVNSNWHGKLAINFMEKTGLVDK